MNAALQAVDVSAELHMEVDTEAGYLYYRWQHHAEGQAYRNSLLAVIETMRREGVHKVLADDTNLGMIAPDDQEWALSHCLPLTLAVGCTAMAIIVPRDIFGQITVEAVMEAAQERVETALRYRYFEDIDSAKAWLQQQ